MFDVNGDYHHYMKAGLIAAALGCITLSQEYRINYQLL